MVVMNLEHQLVLMALSIVKMLDTIQHFCLHQESMMGYVIVVMGRMNMNLVLNAPILARNWEQLHEKNHSGSMFYL